MQQLFHNELIESDAPIYESVHDGESFRPLTELERLLVDWCCYHADYPYVGVRWIAYSSFEDEPYEADWFSDAETAFRQEWTHRTRKKTSSQTRRIAILLNLPAVII